MNKKLNWDGETKFAIKFILVLLAMALAYTLGGYNTLEAHKNDGAIAINAEKREIVNMQVTCEHSYTVQDGKLEQECGQLIDSIESKGYEVLNKNGRFWAEYPTE